MLECKKLSFKYNDGAVGITAIDFSTHKGNIIGVIGSNGAGKSTFFKCLLGLLKPQSGELVHNGETVDYSKKSLRSLRQSVNLVLQDPERQIFYSNVYDDVAMGPKNLKLSEEEIAHRTMTCLKEVQADSFMDRPVQYLSFGQKKRVSIAGVLALSCDVILLDEPETGLDPVMRSDMLKLIQKLSTQGKKIILSSHNMDMIYHICDYVYLMHQGSMIASGPVETIMTNEAKLQATRLELPLLVKVAKTMGTSPEALKKTIVET
ncbi:ABC transporter ATP-binding protein [Fusibacter paucivorans]|uniref:ABC transporter ATP-binding protein n=1 Tax=Fusibacter paucivorans TaxID=76009 RepID=A0ABS5PQ34_9FIRM|nr:ABC transporter ATP-binding protein [Fusibacter paucivorans]MBS7527156.1 ABC transporter ATP-binding protein [Fusibacter paucivorans]